MSVDTNCHKKFGILNRTRKFFHFPNDVIGIEKKVRNQAFLNYSSLKNQSKFVHKLYVFYNMT